MSDQMPLEEQLKKNTEIKVEPQVEDVFQQEMKANLDEQKKRFEEQKKAKEFAAQQKKKQQREQELNEFADELYENASHKEQEKYEKDIEALNEALEEKREEVAQNAEKETKGKLSKRVKKGKGKKTVQNHVLKNRRKQAVTKAQDEKEQNAFNAMLASMNSFEEKEEEGLEVLKLMNMEELKAEHEVKEKVTVKKHMFKADEVITEKVVTDKEEKTARKKAVAKRLTALSNEVIDKRVKARNAVPILYKKHLDYKTFSEISDFSSLCKDQEELNTISNLFSMGEEKKKKFIAGKEKQMELKEKFQKENIFPAMNILTGKIMSIDPFSFELYSDEAIAKSADKLEEVSRIAVSYRSLLSKNPDYVDYLSKEKSKDGSNMADLMIKQLDRLTAVSDYYRLRRVVIEDELYCSLANEEIQMEEEKNDTVQMKRLKKMMRASYQAGINLNRILGGTQLADLSFEKEKGMDRDMMSLLPVHELEKETKDRSKADIIKSRITDYTNRNMIVNQIESERYFQAPLWMQNALTLDVNKLKENKINPDAGYGMGGSQTDMPMLKTSLKISGKQELFDRRRKMVKDKTGKTAWSSKQNFVGGTDKYLKDIEISDDWNRTPYAFAMAYNYRLTDEEVMEMTDLISIQEDSKKWDEIKKDKEAVAFYESAYKEMCMKLISSIYASARRQSETIGSKALMLHPIDLAAQMTAQLRTITFSNSVITNVDTESNNPLIEKLFAENNTENKYAFNMQDYLDHGKVAASLNMKTSEIGIQMAAILTSGSPKLVKAFFGDEDFMENEVRREYRECMQRKVPFTESWQMDIMEDNDNRMVQWYLTRHPEFFTKKYLTKKCDGEYILAHSMNSGIKLMLNGNEEGFAHCLKNKSIDAPTQQEIDEYEKFLKENNYPVTRDIYDHSDEWEKEDINPEQTLYTDNIKRKGEKFKMKEVLENRKKDPYGVNLVRTGFKELEFKDKDGKIKYKRGMGVI